MDILLCAVVVIEFAQSLHTSAPALLPVLIFEGWAYGEGLGALMGGGAAGLILLITWWVQQTVWHQAFASASVVFWFSVLGLLGSMPLVLRERLPQALSGTLEKPSFHSLPSTRQNPPGENTVAELDRTMTACSLTPRECEIYVRMYQGESLRKISRDLRVSYSTVKTHARHIAQKVERFPDCDKI